MNPPTIGPMLACLCVAAFHGARAQSDPSRYAHSELTLSIGVAHADQFDATASPLRFAGQGYDVTARYGVTTGRFSLSAALDGGARRLSSATPTADIAEHVTGAELRLGVRRAIGASGGGSRLSVGADVATMLSVTAHYYEDPNRNISDFVIGSVTLGPSVAWRQSIGDGTGRVQLSIPVLGFVDHPYSLSRSRQAPIDARFATVATMHGVRGEISYAPAATRRVGIVYGYRFEALHYADVQPLASVSQTLSIGLVTRFGRGAQ